MRRTVVFVVMAVVVLVAIPVAGMSDTLSVSGGTPSGVFMSVETPVARFQLCPEDPVGTDPVSFGPTTVEVGQTSHVLAYFTSTWVGFERATELTVRLEISDGDGFFESSPEWIARGGRGHSTGTVMWAFLDVEPGVYTVQPSANVGASQGAVNSGDGATLHTCALSAFVIPVS